MLISAKHKIGSVVYLLTDEDQKKRVVTGIMVRSGNLVQYELSCGAEMPILAVDIEISKNKVFA